MTSNPLNPFEDDFVALPSAKTKSNTNVLSNSTNITSEKNSVSTNPFDDEINSAFDRVQTVNVTTQSPNPTKSTVPPPLPPKTNKLSNSTSDAQQNKNPPPQNSPLMSFLNSAPSSPKIQQASALRSSQSPSSNSQAVANPPMTVTSLFSNEVTSIEPQIPDLSRRNTLSSSIPSIPIKQDFFPSDKQELQRRVEVLEAERLDLQKQIQQLKQAASANTGIDSTIQNMINDLPYSIHHFRTFSEKSDLLKAAVETNNSNVILNVIFFLKEYLEPSLFVKLLFQHQLSISVYITYLKQRNNTNALLALYRLLNRVQDEGMLLLQLAFRWQDPHQRIAALERVLEFFNSHPQSFAKWQIESTKSQIALLQRQITIEEFDSKLAQQGEAIFQRFTRPFLPNSTMALTLFYCSFYHPTAPKDKLSSPENMEKSFNLSKKIYQYQFLQARAKIADWTSVKAIAEVKGLLGVSYKTPLGFETFVECLHANRGPDELFKFFLSKVEPSQRKFEVASKYRCPDIAVEALIETKDKATMGKYKSQLVEEYGAERSQLWREKIDASMAKK